MPTPKKYKSISLNSAKYKWYFLGFTGIGILICLLAILIPVYYQFNPFPLFGIGFLVAIWGWGPFLIINWFGEKSKIALRFPNGISNLLEWGATLFLNMWFVVGSIGVICFIWDTL